MKSTKILDADKRAKEHFSSRFGTVLRKFEAEGGDIHRLAEAVYQEAADLRRWAEGGKIPGHSVSLLLGELPRHLADEWIAPTGLRLVSLECAEGANAMLAASSAASFAARVTQRHADGTYCHRDRAETREDARRTIAELQAVAGE